jgi:hypothetical protein
MMMSLPALWHGVPLLLPAVLGGVPVVGNLK